MSATAVNQRREAAMSTFTGILAELTAVSPSRIDVTLLTHPSTASVCWQERKDTEGRTVALIVQLYLPALLTGAEGEASSRDADALAGYWVHEACHVIYTDRAAWGRACARSVEFRRVVNAIEDVRIERLLITSGKAPQAAMLLQEVTERSVWTGPATPETVNKHHALAAVLAYLGRATCNGFALSLADTMRAALNPENRATVDQVLAAIPALTSTQDVVDLAASIFDRARQARFSARN